VREFATRDASRKLEIINEIKDAAVAEQERHLMFDYFERLMQGIQARTSRQEQVLAATTASPSSPPWSRVCRRTSKRDLRRRPRPS
jgi:hypothetical protein